MRIGVELTVFGIFIIVPLGVQAGVLDVFFTSSSSTGYDGRSHKN